MHNLRDGSWLWWIHAFIPWYVVIVSQFMVFRAMRKFLPVRFRWLLALEPPRSNTVLVEGLPDSQSSDKALEQFYNQLFPGCVESAYVVKNTQVLESLVASLKKSKLALEKLEYQRRANRAIEGIAENISVAREEVNKLEAQARMERQRILARAALPMVEVQSDDGDIVMALQPAARSIYSSSGFVTFTSEREAMLALKTRCSPDAEEFMTSIPPQPADIIYDDLRIPLWRQQVYALLGYACIIGLFFAYLPFIVAISSVTNLRTLEHNYAWVRHAVRNCHLLGVFLEGVLSTLAIVLFMSFLPNVLMIIFSTFFSLKANAWSQLKLQKWYFGFMVIFILLIAAVGGHFVSRVREIIWSPAAVFDVLESSLPNATHFYLNFIVMQWGVHALNITRYYNMTVYFALRAVLGEDRAVELAEPEPQAYEGIGGRSARFALNLVIGLVYAQLNPLIIVLVFINFAICKVFYGYLVVFAETRKHDLGGVFFVTQMWHVQFGLFIYLLLIVGILSNRGERGQVVISALSFIYLLYSMHRFRAFAWEYLPFAEWCTNEAMAGAAEEMERYRALGDTRPRYIQPELNEAAWAEKRRRDSAVVHAYTQSSNDRKEIAKRARRISVWASNIPGRQEVWMHATQTVHTGARGGRRRSGFFGS
jgi:hypothetical protein